MGRHKADYRPDIDGLRTLAILPVVFYHVHIGLFAGGFVGVDVFFVISGYLITSTLVSDLRHDRFSILDFYDRRIRRIFPALFATLLACTLFAGLWFPLDSFASYGQSMIAVALFVSNAFFWFTSTAQGYFDDASNSQLLLHTWSLAVEEQFYIFLPIFLVLVRRQSRHTMAIWLALFSVASFALSVWAVTHRPLDAFYLVFPRAWELLIGALLALKILPPLASRLARDVAVASGVVLILIAVFSFSNRTPFPGTSALLPCVGAWLVIYAGEGGDSAPGRVLASRPFVYIGKRSYSLYLWHWPIVVVVAGLNTGLLNAPSTILILAASFVAAILSYRFVEQPFRTRKWSGRRAAVLLGGLSVSVVTLAAGAILVETDGLPSRFDATTRSLVEANRARMGEHATGSCSNWLTDVHTFEDIAFCPRGSDAQRKILFWGDSHMDVLRPLIEDFYSQNQLEGHGALFAIAAGCAPSPSMNRRQAGYHCDRFSALTLARAKEPDVDTLFLAFSANWADVDNELCVAKDGLCVSNLSRQQEADLFIDDLSTFVRDLRAMGKRVILALPIPTYNLMIPSMEINAITLGAPYRVLRDAGILRRLDRKDFASIRERMMAVAKTFGAEVYDPRADLCAGVACVYEKNRISIYADDNHIAASQVGIFRDSLQNALH